ncbi:MAG TPA: thermonuclease family protein [Myxococcota bacterium]|nr:thermonuclease family protein [Myxococcota bacterium]
MNKHDFLSRAFGAALVAFAALVSLPAQARAQLGPCRALRVADADSADLRCSGELVHVRLRNVAAPRPGQVGYAEATRALAELLRARDVWILAEPAVAPVDPNGRSLVYLADRHGANLNVELVLLGWATYSTDGGASRFEKSFRAAETEARTERRALWSVSSYSAER